MSTTPSYVGTPKVGMAIVSIANANRDGTGTIGTVFSAGTSGSRIDKIIIKATGTTTAGMVRLYINDGANSRLYDEVAVPAVTPSATAGTFQTTLASNQITFELPIILPNGYSLRASTEKAETFNVVAFGGDF